MPSALDLLEALSGPAAILGADGIVSGNAAFRAIAPTPKFDHPHVTDWVDAPLADGSTLWRARQTRAGEQRLIARERLLATLSHEIRTPLNGVLGMAGLLARTALDAEQTDYLAALTASGEHLLSLVGDVLDFAKLDAGRLELESAAFDVALLIQSVCELLSPRAHAKGLEIAWAVDAATPRLLGDEGRLRQVLFNLAGNAIKFTRRGGVLVTAETTFAGDGRSSLRVSVADTGPGVPAAARERIFDPFAHATESDATRPDGAGLGLAIVRRLTDAFGGEVRVEGAAGRGATFVFEAPFVVAGAAATMPGPLAGRAVAVLSTSAIVREGAAAQIEALGGALVDARAAHALLVDHGGRGDEDLAARSGHPHALVLLAPEERGLIDRYRAAGFVGYLIKPLRPGSLAARLLAAKPGRLAPATRGQPDERESPPAMSGLRILLAEDNPVNALLATTLLRREGCSVDRASDGHEALAALAGAPYDLVLMDVRMPGLGGIEATRRYRARGGRIPVIALTADAFEDDRRACLAAGMDDHLTKPLAPEALRATLARWTAPSETVRLAG